MISLRRLVIAGICCASLGLGTGCALLHELKPHRLWRLNRQPPPPSTANFSVSDPLPTGVLPVSACRPATQLREAGQPAAIGDGT